MAVVELVVLESTMEPVVLESTMEPVVLAVEVLVEPQVQQEQQILEAAVGAVYKIMAVRAVQVSLF